VTVASEYDARRFHAIAAASAVPVRVAGLGRVGGDDLTLRIGDRAATLDLEAARGAYEAALPGALA
jgi:hypothetical protein